MLCTTALFAQEPEKVSWLKVQDDGTFCIKQDNVWVCADPSECYAFSFTTGNGVPGKATGTHWQVRHEGEDWKTIIDAENQGVCALPSRPIKAGEYRILLLLDVGGQRVSVTSLNTFTVEAEDNNVTSVEAFSWGQIKQSIMAP